MVEIFHPDSCTRKADKTAAPVNAVEAQLKDIIQNLYNLIVQPFDHQGSATQDAMKREM